MKIPVKKILSWLGRVIATAAVQEATDRLTRPKVEQPTQQGEKGNG